MGDDENRIDTCSFAHNTERVRGVAGSRHAGNGITEGETRLRRRERQRGGEQRASAIRVLVYLPGISCTPAHTCASCSPAPPPPCKWSHAKATRTEQGPHEKRLLNALLGPYNTLERPVANESEPLEVKFGLTLQQIIDVEWVDYNLRWNETEFGGVKDLRITPNKIWRPDILMYNSIIKDIFEGITNEDTLLQTSPRHWMFNFQCKPQLFFFPINVHFFCIIIATCDTLDLVLNSEGGGDLTNFITNGEWYLLEFCLFVFSLSLSKVSFFPPSLCLVFVSLFLFFILSPCPE
ncbi:Uncharacterized protein, isoform D [Gryllus bimaculatus]|nr:Uncharacterized protein, isoform D [Gryllus bimaculatus]